MRIHIELVVADIGLKKKTKVAALVVLLQYLGIDFMFLLRLDPCILLLNEI